MLNRKYKTLVCLLIISITIFFSRMSVAVPDDPAEREVSVKKVCGATEDTCFTTLDALSDWIAGTRKPDAGNPLFVHIGPGVFPGRLFMKCPDEGAGYTTYRGSGRQNTTVGGGFFYSTLPDQSNSCKNIAVEDLTVDIAVNEPFHNLQIGVWFLGSDGSSTWKNVEIIGNRSAWYDAKNVSGNTCSTESTRQKHLFFSTTLKLSETAYTAGGAIEIFFSSCAESKIWGSELRADIGPLFTTAPTILTGIKSIGTNNIIRLFGSNMHMIGTSDGVAADPTGLKAQLGGSIHTHGSEVVVRHAGTSVNSSVTSLWADGAGSTIHTPGTSFGIQAAGSGTATRILETNSGKVLSPFQWPANTEPPSFTSIDGMDMIVETDCSSDGSCSAGNYSHSMTYDSNCTTDGTWFNSTLGACRGVNPNP